MLVIGGVTASGKSSLAISVAETCNGCIINADSVQLYKDLSILTARPSETDEARVPHMLYGMLEADKPCSAADWLSMVKAAIETARCNGQFPIIVGGSGLYLHALLHGLAPIPEIDPEIRNYVRSLSSEKLFIELASCDHEMASRLPKGDRHRLMRALEIKLSTGRSQLSWLSEAPVTLGESAEHCFTLLPDRLMVRAKARARMISMLHGGALSQVRELCRAHADPLALPIAKAHGLAELVAVLRGDMSESEAIERTSVRVGQYVKRQETWFRQRMAEAVCFTRFGSDPGVLKAIIDIIASKAVDRRPGIG